MDSEEAEIDGPTAELVNSAKEIRKEFVQSGQLQ